MDVLLEILAAVVNVTIGIERQVNRRRRERADDIYLFVQRLIDRYRDKGVQECGDAVICLADETMVFESLPVASIRVQTTDVREELASKGIIVERIDEFDDGLIAMSGHQGENRFEIRMATALGWVFLVSSRARRISSLADLLDSFLAFDQNLVSGSNHLRVGDRSPGRHDPPLTHKANE